MKTLPFLFLIFLAISCKQNRYLERTYLNDSLSKEDSFRKSIGLLTMNNDWRIDTIEYGIYPSWTGIVDTNEYVICKRYILMDSINNVIKSKVIEYDSITDRIYTETDYYSKNNIDSTLEISITYLYDYISNIFYCTVDTLDFIKQKKAKLEYKELEDYLESARKNNLNIDGTFYVNKKLNILKSYLKITQIEREEALQLIEKF